MFTNPKRIENLSNYSKQLDIVEQFINDTDFINCKFETPTNITDDIFYIVKEYTTKEESANMLEDHIEMIDVHFALSGDEAVYLAPAAELNLVTEYNSENDCAWYSASNIDDVERYTINQGEHLVLFPGECHEPEVRVSNEKNIKVIFKIKTN